MFTRASYSVNQTTAWKMLSNDQCEEIFLTAMELLERTGAEVLNQEALAVLEKNGCNVEGSRVRIPSAVSEWAVRTAPSRVTLCDRNGKRALLLETNNVYYGPGSDNQMVIDPISGETRKPVKADVANAAIVCDALKNVNFAMANGLPTDVDGCPSVHAFEALVANTTKPVIQKAGSVKEAAAIIDLAAAAAGSLKEAQKNPFFALIVENQEPLVHGEDDLAQVMLAAQNKVPLVYGNRLVAGETAPANPAGAIVVALANALVGIVLAQCVQQGAPVIAGAFLTIKDRVNDMVSYAAPEIALMGAGMANVLRFIGIPSISFGGASDTKISDAQMGLESAFSILAGGLSGANLVTGVGQTESGLAGSLELLVMGDEAMGMARRVMRGILVNEEMLARGVIDVVSPGGHYLGEEHTLKFFKSEFWWPTLMNRSRIDDWMAAGAKPMDQRVKEKTQNLIKTHKPEALSAEKIAAMQAVVAKAGK